MKRLALAFLFLLLVAAALAAPPYDRTVDWTNPTLYTDGSPIPTTDALVTHVFVCTSATDNATCVEVGVSAPNAASWTGPVPQQPVDTWRYYRARAESTAHLALSAYSESFAFFLRGTAAPGAGAIKGVR